MDCMISLILFLLALMSDERYLPASAVFAGLSSLLRFYTSLRLYMVWSRAFILPQGSVNIDCFFSVPANLGLTAGGGGKIVSPPRNEVAAVLARDAADLKVLGEKVACERRWKSLYWFSLERTTLC